MLSDEFLLLCSRNKALMSPVILLQAKTREKVRLRACLPILSV